MATPNPNPSSPVLSPDLTGLSDHTVATLFEVQRGQGGWIQKPGTAVVKAPLSECALELQANWESRFEESGVDSQAPNATALAQSGQATDMARLLDNTLGTSFADYVANFEGRSSVTKLNSTQTFSGMPPAQLQVSALFRAWQDPETEVEAPINQLAAWLLPKYLAADGSIIQRLINQPLSTATLIPLLMPSLTPSFIGMIYKRRSYYPLVIESLTDPLDSPSYRDGSRVHATVSMTFATLAALDRKDWESNIQRLTL